MKLSLKSFCLLTLLLPMTIAAQKTPGYLGKRFSVEYNAFVFPSFFNPNSAEVQSTDSYLSEVKPSINLQNYIVGQFSASKKISLIGSFGFNKTYFIPDGYFSNEPQYDEYPGMQVFSYNAGIRLFTQHFAPLGRYVEFRIGLSQVKTEDFSYTYTYYDPLTNLNFLRSATIEGSSMVRPTIAVAWGTNRVIKDIVIISYGLDINCFPGGLGYYRSLLSDGTRSELYYEEGNTPANQEELLKLAAGRYGMQCFINLRLGVGILL